MTDPGDFERRGSDDPTAASAAGEPDPSATRGDAAPPGGPQFVAPSYPANPFVPTYREPWLNPAKRRSAGLLAAVAAVLLLGLGMLIGAGVSSGHGRGGSGNAQRVERDGGADMHFGDGHGAGIGGHGRGGRGLPGRPAPSQPGTVPTATSVAPSSSHS